MKTALRRVLAMTAPAVALTFAAGTSQASAATVPPVTTSTGVQATTNANATLSVDPMVAAEVAGIVGVSANVPVLITVDVTGSATVTGTLTGGVGATVGATGAGGTTVSG